MDGPISSWTPERKKEYFRAYRKKRKDSFRDRGICPNCEKKPSEIGKVCCSQCLSDKKLTMLFGTAGPYRLLYSELFERQGGKCGICHTHMKRPVLDHNHATMEVRGLLCQSCNIGLGQFQDNPQILKMALDYLENNAGIGIIMKKRENK